MKSRNVMLLITLCMIISTLATACQPTAPTAPVENKTTTQETISPATGESASQPVEITYSYRVTSPAQETHLKWVVDSFNQKYDGEIHVTASSVDDETYKTKQLVELRSDNAPDVFYSWEGARAKTLIDAGFALSLDKYYTQYGWDKSLNPAGVALATFDGQKYFLPYQMSSAVIWYRKDIFSQFNLTPPTTWEELQQIVDTLKANDIAPFILTDKENWEAQFEWTAILVNKHGLAVYQDLMNNKIPWTDSRVVDAFATLKQMVDDGWYHDGILSMGLSDGAIPFGKGEAAMWYQGNWLIGTLKGTNDSIPYEVGFFPWPMMSDTNAISEVFCENTLMVNANSENPDAAAEFLNYFVSTEVQTKKTYEGDGPFPANTSVDLTQLSPVEQDLGDLMSNSGGFSFMHVDHGFDPAIANTFLVELQGVISDSISPEDAAKATEDQAIKVRGEVQ